MSRYRCLGTSTFAPYCGYTNQIYCGGPNTESRINAEVENKNIRDGFGPVAKCYAPETILKHYGYCFPDFSELPPAYTMCPFAVRNDIGDEPFDFIRPPWYHAWYSSHGQGSQTCPPRQLDTPFTTRAQPAADGAVKKRSRYEDIEDDEHFGHDEESSQSNAQSPGSSPNGSQRELLEHSPYRGRRKKVRRTLILDEASCSEEVRASDSACHLTSPRPACPQNRTPTHTPVFGAG